MTKRHKLLERQIKRHLKQGLDGSGPEFKEELESLFAAIDQAYRDFDSDRALIERSQDLSSKELMEEKTKAEENARQLATASAALMDAQSKLISAAKMSALGEMAAGIAHEINTPLGVMSMRLEQMEECLNEGDLDSLDFLDALHVLRATTERIAKIVSGLRFFARDGRRSESKQVKVSSIIEETLNFCQERIASCEIHLQINRADPAFIESVCTCRSVEISQVLLNLLNNAFDAIEPLQNKWIKIHVAEVSDEVEISVTDCGQGVSPQVQEKIMQPFFTTKDIGKGTGLGLSISKGIMEEHGGRLFLDLASPNTKFVMRLPKGKPGSNKSVA